ncbi:MAG: dihydropteroate synthase [Bacteroidales bacterium]|nr:dihydropteroate synthase [Bacteroidales bacterium]
MTKIMAIINLTPDSFFAGSRVNAQDFEAKFLKAVEEGADIIDIGACSSRPGSVAVTQEQEWQRLENALDILKSLRSGVQISIDTFRSGIVRKAYDKIGPFIVNDIYAGAADKAMLKTVEKLELPYIAMFNKPLERGLNAPTPFDQIISFYENFPLTDKMIIDPGFGAFSGKTVEENYNIFDNLPALKRFGRPILVGISRKSMVYIPAGKTPETCLEETLALEKRAIELGADILRVHDVAPIKELLR